ncbi:DUF4434 domain-containing protein [Clostridium luticellarii]|jgi:hypothetical protein|uniref:F5/8 type C domain protein n=1 Tax=Clostridium luticellarii TaxID=1691940 RepID=A0A2T0BP28_9CLOT|nr:DUF4434 domain-containing protein [Clostridium luticellarii]MCI1944627.1 DUF4434 domain-containing protein [Clostridium luticellarii]MCI1968126.1 DUF4434 domain-containing protein [Clostridium luticellarii]MCI1994761.1 DUF4434 domain-containing protein [Clostridium luticellarii]MCI2038993.1 DUF4434 domain-containing protein [Clostridium luticellarii]PRR85631.1 F5/8 type C domain protein [Clostridium luticellarii]
MWNKIRFSILLIILISVFGFIYFNSPLRANKDHPIITGSFIQLDMTQHWNNDDWKNELNYFKENKMKYIIITNISQTQGNVTKTCYKSNIPGYKKIYGNVDPVELCLKNAEALNLKVFIEPNFNSDWWQILPDNYSWLNSQMNRSNIIADELYKKYHSRYPNAFYGWYFPYEVDNAKFTKASEFDNLSNAINLHLNYLDSKKERLPILLSPFMNSSAGSSKEYASNWQYLFSKTNFKNGDIFCPQDSIGSGRLKLEEVNSWYTALRKAVDKKPGMLFWANAENFDYVNNSSVPLDRFLKQLILESPCVDNIICFSYSHYYSPDNINSGFNKEYSYYVKNGKLPDRKLGIPQNLTISTLEKNKFKITWSSPENTDDICGYEVYRDNVLISRVIVQRKYGGSPERFSKSIIDIPLLKENTSSYTYTVRSLGFSGNVSKPSDPVTVKVDAINKLPHLLSRNCKYSIVPSPHEKYNDINLTKLTDGRYSSTNSVKDNALVGWYNEAVDVTVDLGKIESVQQFMVSYLRDPIPWAELPERASIGVSQDGINYTPIGLLRIPSVPFSDRYGSNYKIYLTLDKTINARYVKLTSVNKANYYIFMDEFEIRK